uniref:Transposon Ty3-G Gag-Pol polyprotein n=1 Tax=Cajanus cajan TaxID=3821 RepID=A0A151TQN3_CAJCA|nr:Transposon Ty3-G Gag-Pol polyprotein [Cajanus cajan]
MPGIDPKFLCHRLAVCQDARPVAQKKRKMGDEKRKAANTEIKKLLQAKFIREVTYTTWLANVVLVKKANEKWRMCTDYTDLNKACPKEAYPLPCIDRLVDGASGHSIFSFLDTYSGYNQIRMHLADEEKTTFITDNANFCYRVMPFGLKNVGATYQRLMDKVFQG